MKIWYSPYSLKPKRSLSSKAGAGPREGALLKIEFSDGLIGFSDLHPHPELGDENLQENLRRLSCNEPSVILNRSLHWALIDAHARKNQQSLFAGRTLPGTHALVTDILQTDSDHLFRIRDQGYKYLKLKLGRDLPAETLTLLELSRSLQGMKLRLDFNESLDARVFRDWWAQVEAVVRSHVDYIEDPFPYAADRWSGHSAPLALDRSLSLDNLKSFDGPVVIFKPAVSDTHWLNNIHRKVIFSTYMDHPVGEMFAIFAAAQHYNDVGEFQVCGLRTWTLFEANEFTESLHDSGPELSVAEGFGLGFDEQLNRQRWKLLT